MTKRIILITTSEFGFAETHNTRRPIEKRYQINGDVLPAFGDCNVKIDLDEAKQIGGIVLLVNETPTTYSSQRIHACPDCGFPMRRQASKKEARYVCKHAETRREVGIKDDHHAYVRSWTEDELTNQVAA